MKQDNLIHKIIRIALWVFMALGVAVLLYLYTSPDLDPLKGTEEMDTLMSRSGVMLSYSMVLLIIGAAIAVIFPIIFIVSNPKNAVKVLIVLAILVGLAGLSYLFASSSIDGAVYEKFEVTARSSKTIGGALILTYVLAGLAVLAIIFSSISKMFK